MPSYTLPANLRSKATINVFVADQEENPNGEQYVVPVSSLAVGAYDAAPTADDTYNGSTITSLLAGAALAQWETVYLSSSSTWLLADANGSGTQPARGLAVAATASGAAATVLTQGTVRNDAWAWTIGGNIYLSETAGGLTQTAPTSSSNVQAVGWAISADVAIFNFTPTFRPVA
jgi:hypothetical protein